MTFPKLYPFMGFTIRNGGEDPQGIVVKDRARWALATQMHAGSGGVTPITGPGHRWADYVFNPRKTGMDIGTINQSQDRQFPETHALDVFHSGVTLGGQGSAA